MNRTKPSLVATLHGLALISLLMSSISMAQTSRHQINVDIAEQQLVPSYSRLHSAAGDFQQASSGCESFDGRALAAAQGSFKTMLNAWARAEIWRFGPIDYLERRHRIWFWPDKHGRSGKQLRKLIAAADPARLEAERFADGSVAVQGLSAAERLLFADDALKQFQTTPYRCELLKAISGNLVSLTRNLTDDWQRPQDGDLAMIRSSENGNDIYEEGAEEVTAAYLKSLHTGMVAISTLKLARPLGDNIDKARGKRAEAWRSGLSEQIILGNLEALHLLYAGDRGKPGLKALISAENQALAEQIDKDFDKLIDLTRSIDNLAEVVADPARRAQVEALHKASKALTDLIGKQLPAALGLTLGFNSLDGD